MLHPALILVSNLQIKDSLIYEQDSPKTIRYPPVADMCTYVYSNNIYQHWLLYFGGGGGGRVVY